uniref:EF-hand and coiled-coil domain containing 1 n=1 Tax=Nothoprocta perdicaria TaxID=30464 RepID=A0A8C6YZC3_NOTPE
MEPPEGWDPYRRPARRTQWLVSALAYHYGLDRGVENEIVVLATGLDQYLQEIFHHLDCAGEGRIPGEDFRTLCQVLGLEAAAAAEPEECAGLYEGLAAELTFRQFHARLCGYFSTQAGAPRAVPRLPLGAESEHIETQIRLRSGGAGEENGSLRELVEDMRAALQSSDARCLALQVSREPARELKSSQEAVANLEDCNRTLKREQAEMRKKIEEARHAVLNSLGKVKELEVKANEVPYLQIYIQQLESELQHYR